MNMHPAAWIAWATCAGIVAFSTTNPFYLALVIAIAWFVYATCHVSGPTARSFRVFLIAGLVAMVIRTALVFFGTIDANNVAFAALEGLRLATILIVFGTFNAVTDPFGVVRMAPRRFHEPALAAALALSIAPRTIASAQRVREAQTLRGLRTTGLRSLPALAVPILETGMEDAVTLAESMDARGHGHGTRSRYRPQRWDRRSIVATGAAITAAGVFTTAAFAGAGGLHPSTFPLLWPEVSAGLLAAAGLLAVPGLRRTRGDT
jgi:energy-coupling factor transport system permease protein